jgi:NAD(P)-dependent dehydrogenase (short-subunit alcohol dehydrogenase family)
MNQKIVIITGANSGIGKEAALKFAQQEYTLIMACRNLDKSKAVQREIISDSENQHVYLKEVDMSSFASILTFCNDIKNQFPRLDILIHNAAYFNHGEDYRLSTDNIEITFATNVVGPFLITNLLLSHLKKSNDARVLNASSNIIKHFFSPKKEIDFNNLHAITDNNYKHSVYKAYRNSKMAFLMLTFRMADEYKNFGVKVNSLQINGARMSKETLMKFKPVWRMVARIQNLFFSKPEFIAQSYFDICTSERFENTTGEQFNHKQKIMKSGPEKPTFKDIWGTDYYPVYASRPNMQEKVWTLCLSLTNNYLKHSSNAQ